MASDSPKVLVNKLRTKINVNYIERSIPYRAVNTLPLLKCIKTSTDALSFMGIILLHSGNRHVSISYVGHLQGGENKNTIKTCLKHFRHLKIMWLYNLAVNK